MGRCAAGPQRRRQPSERLAHVSWRAEGVPVAVIVTRCTCPLHNPVVVQSFISCSAHSSLLSVSGALLGTFDFDSSHLMQISLNFNCTHFHTYRGLPSKELMMQPSGSSGSRALGKVGHRASQGRMRLSKSGHVVGSLSVAEAQQAPAAPSRRSRQRLVPPPLLPAQPRLERALAQAQLGRGHLDELVGGDIPAS